MKKARAVYSTVVLITAVLFFWTARLYVAGILAAEVLLVILLRVLLLSDRQRTQITLETRTASIAGQNLSVCIQVKSSLWLAAGMLDAVLEIENKLIRRTERIPVTISLSRKTLSAYLPYVPKCCGHTQISLRNVYFCDIMGFNILAVPEPKPVYATIYPEPLPLDVSADLSLSGFQEGDQQTVNRRGHDPSEVFELREYRPGDDVRSIHWKLSGKMDKFLVKESSDTSHYTTTLLLDAGLNAGNIVCTEELLSVAAGLALTFSEKLMELGILHYIGIPAAGQLFFSQITERAEYTKTTDIWMGLTLEEQAGEGLKLFLSDPFYNNCRHMIYVTAGRFPGELDMIPSDVHMTAVCLLEEGSEVRVIRKGQGVLMEIPAKRLKESVYNIAI